MIGIALDHYVLGPGDRGLCTVEWQAAEKPPKEIRVRLRMETEGRGTTDRLELAEVEIPGSASGTVEVPFQIPHDAPYSYDGRLMRVRYSVDVRLKLPWASDEKMSIPFRVG